MPDPDQILQDALARKEELDAKKPPAYSPPTLEQMADAVDRVDRHIRSEDTPTPAQELGLLNAESLAMIASGVNVIADQLGKPPAPVDGDRFKITNEILKATNVIATVIAALEVRERQVQDVATDGFAAGRRVDQLAVLTSVQVGDLIEAFEVVGPWIAERAAEGISPEVGERQREINTQFGPDDQGEGQPS